MAEAILCFYSENSWTKMTQRSTKRYLHVILQIIGSGMAIVGIVIYIIENGNRGRAHFGTTHGTLGLIALIFLIITCLNGATAFFAIRMKVVIKPIYNKIFHNVMGILAFTVGKFISFNSVWTKFLIYVFLIRYGYLVLWI